MKFAGQNKSQTRKKVTGVVRDQNGEPIIGANVVEKGTTNGTITDVDGRFSLEVYSKGTLLVSYIGFTSRELIIGNQSNIEIQLKEDMEALDEVVVIGYGTAKKKDLTGAITQIRAEEITQANSLILVQPCKEKSRLILVACGNLGTIQPLKSVGLVL